MIYVLALSASILTNSVAHLLFRRAAQQLRLMPIVAVALCFALVPLLTWIALHGLSLSQVYMATAVTPILIAGLGSLFLHERFPARAIIPYAMIVLGCILFYL